MRLLNGVSHKLHKLKPLLVQLVPAPGLVALVALVACGSKSAPVDPHAPTVANLDGSLERAGSFLAAQQAPDGAFRSKAYSALRDGWSLTPLVTLALRVTPAREAYTKAVGFVAGLVDGERVRGVPEVTYPLYAWAIGALVLSAPDNVENHRKTRDALLLAVRGQQLSSANGWKADDASFGGWGYSPRVPARPEGEVRNELLTSNLSATLLGIGALALAGQPAPEGTAGFVERCRNPDGGFFFSPALPDSNKAGRGPNGYRSYGSMTADGLRALVRLGKPIDDPAVIAAIAWLDKHFDPAKNPGEFAPVDEVRRASSYYYWVWSVAHAFEHVKRGDKRWAAALATELLRRQRADGSWANEASEMREDDPVVATSFAVAALAVCRSVIAGERVTHAGWK